MKTTSIFLWMALIITSAGCSKNEQPVEEAKFTALELLAITTDTMRLKAMVDDVILTDTLITPDGLASFPVQYNQAEHRMRLFDLYTNRLVLDTMILYKPGFVNNITFFQPAAGSSLVWVGPPVNEPLPDKGQVKISIAFNYPPLPETVKVVVENTTATGPVQYAATDSFLLHKGAFSKYFSGTDIGDRKPRLKFYTSGTDRRLLAEASPSAFAATNADYSIYLFRNSSGSSGGVFTLRAEKLY